MENSQIGAVDSEYDSSFAVSQNEFPINNEEERKRIIIESSDSDLSEPNVND